MKYRMLTETELHELEDDLKQFLIVNGLDGAAWEKLNIENPKKAIKLVELFSDTVLQRVYEKMKFIEFRSEKSCLVFHCTEKNMELISVNRKENSAVSLATPESIHEALQNNASELTMFKTQKKYTGNREEEIHQMMNNGCTPSHEAFWLLLKKLV